MGGAPFSCEEGLNQSSGGGISPSIPAKSTYAYNVNEGENINLVDTIMDPRLVIYKTCLSKVNCYKEKKWAFLSNRQSTKNSYKGWNKMDIYVHLIFLGHILTLSRLTTWTYYTISNQCSVSMFMSAHLLQQFNLCYFRENYFIEIIST